MQPPGTTRRSTSPRSWPTPEEIDRHMAIGRKQRADAIAATAARGARYLGKIVRAITGRLPGADSADAGAAFRPPLTAIRCSAETLRDNPDLTPAQRARFVDILLAEQQRLEHLLTGPLGPQLGSR